MSSSFKQTSSLEKRKEVSARILDKYPDRVPVLVEKGDLRRKDIPELTKKKYIVPVGMTVGAFVHEIRKNLISGKPNLTAHQAIFLHVAKGTIPPNNMMMGNLYLTHHDEDGFLYVSYVGENTFG